MNEVKQNCFQRYLAQRYPTLNAENLYTKSLKVGAKVADILKSIAQECSTAASSIGKECCANQKITNMYKPSAAEKKSTLGWPHSREFNGVLWNKSRP